MSCGLSAELRQIIGFRVIDAVGGALVLANGRAIASTLYAREGRGRAHQGISELMAGDRGNDVDRGCDFRNARRGRAQKNGVVECRSDGLVHYSTTPSLHHSKCNCSPECLALILSKTAAPRATSATPWPALFL